MNNNFIWIGITIGVFVSAIIISSAFFINSESNPKTISISNQTIPLDQNNKEIHLQVGKKFLLKLDQNYNWDVNVDNQSVVNRVINIMENKSMQWIYKANIPGTATITATGNPICLNEIPSCKLTSLIFRVTVIAS